MIEAQLRQAQDFSVKAFAHISEEADRDALRGYLLTELKSRLMDVPVEVVFVPSIDKTISGKMPRIGSSLGFVCMSIRVLARELWFSEGAVRWTLIGMWNSLRLREYE